MFVGLRRQESNLLGLFRKEERYKIFSKSKNAYTYQAFGYWFPHENAEMSASDKLSNYVVNIKTLQDNTGIDFFCNLPDDIEDKVENASLESIKLDWGFK